MSDSRRPPEVAHLDDLEAIPGPGSLTWHPVRATLGIRAFGTNAYSAENPGDDVVEPHTETTADGYSHEELYFVARGHATFEIDGEQIDAPAGTYVFIPDPESHRHAVAEEPDTTVLSFGGPPTFEPSSWEWSFRAVPLFDTDPPRARSILDDGFEAHPESASLFFHLARLEEREGDREAALEALGRALALEPALAGEVETENDFADLRSDPAYRELISAT
jgi:mannose-6-phosphate isomerase-like protein (cupin superfamily)